MPRCEPQNAQNGAVLDAPRLDLFAHHPFPRGGVGVGGGDGDHGCKQCRGAAEPQQRSKHNVHFNFNAKEVRKPDKLKARIWMWFIPRSLRRLKCSTVWMIR